MENRRVVNILVESINPNEMIVEKSHLDTIKVTITNLGYTSFFNKTGAYIETGLSNDLPQSGAILEYRRE
jgi:hypothetical protein